MTNSVDHEPHDRIALDHVNLLGYQRTNLFNTGMVSLIPNEPGVYILHFYKLGTFYIGSSTAIRNRAVSHKSELIRGTHKNRNVLLSYKESGSEIDFYYRIYPTIEEALQVEHELISYFKQSIFICNLSPVATNNLIPMSEEQRELHSGAVKAQYINNPILLQKHLEHLKRVNVDPKVRQGRSDRKKAEWADPVKRAKNVKNASARMVDQWADPEMRAKRTKANQDRYLSCDLNNKLSETHAANWQDPEFRQKQTEINQQRYDDQPDLRAKLSAIHTEKYKDPEYKEFRNQVNKKRLEDNPDIGKKIGSKLKNRWADPVYRAQQTEKIRARNADPAYRAKLAESARNRKKRKTK